LTRGETEEDSDLLWGIILPFIINEQFPVIKETGADYNYIMCDASYYTGRMIQGIFATDPTKKIYDVSNFYELLDHKRLNHEPAENGQV